MTRSICPLRLPAPSHLLRLAGQSPRRSFTHSCLTGRPRAPQSRHAQLPHLRSSRPGFWRPNSTWSEDVERVERKRTEEADAPAEEDEKLKMPNIRPRGGKDPRQVPAPTPEDGKVPAYELTFTCKPCKVRSGHRISKHGYHNGTVLITCPNCKNRHVISDHLKIFNDTSKTFEEILQEKSEYLKRGELDPDGDFEMWDDGTKTARKRGATGTPQAGETAAV